MKLAFKVRQFSFSDISDELDPEVSVVGSAVLECADPYVGGRLELEGLSPEQVAELEVGTIVEVEIKKVEDAANQ